MPPKARRSSKAPKQKQDPPQFRILSRPSSPGKFSLQTTTDLSEFETLDKQLQPNPPKQLSNNSKAIPSIIDSKDTMGTPSRPRSMPAVASNGRYRGNASASRSIANDTVSLTPSPASKKVNSPSPRQFQSPPKPQTPLRKSVPPSQYYAGPSFHASPAASALPMPKFLSKSVPDLQKTSSLESMMGEEGKSTDSDQSDESPTLRKSRMVEENKTEEGSDIDMFSPADISEKPKQQKENNIAAVADGGSSKSPCTDISKLTSPSTSPKGQVSHHARHDTESSIGGLFPMEIEDSSPLVAKTDISSESLVLCLNTPPIALDEEQRKAKSLELRKLLLSPVPQRSSSASPGNKTGLNAKSSNAILLRTYSHQDSSIPASVPSSKRTNAHHKLQYRAISSSATFSTNRLPAPGSKPSNLRNQSRFPNSSDKTHLSELPANPTPISWYGSEGSKGSYIQPIQNTYKNSAMMPFASGLSSQTYSHGIKPNLTGDSEQIRSMEAYLRGVLQLDKHSSTGANGIQT